MRIGTSVAESGGPDALTKIADQLRRAVDDGFSSAWMANIFGLEALTSLAVAGSHVPGIEVGTAVVPDLSAASGRAGPAGADRGAGAGPGPPHARHRAVAPDRHREHVRLQLRQAGPAHARVPVGAAAAARRQPGRASTASTLQRPYRAVHAARRPGAGAAGRAGAADAEAGRRADRRHRAVDDRPGHGPGPHRAVHHRGRQRGRAAAARGWCASCRCTSPTIAAAARAKAAKKFAIYGQLPSYRAMLDKEGAAGPADVAIIGDEDAVAAQIAALADAG